MAQQYQTTQQAPAKQGNGWGVGALVVGIVAIVASIVPLLGMVAFILGPIAIVLGIIGLTRKFRPRGTSIAGLILGVLAVIAAAIVTALTASFVQAVDDEINSQSSSAAGAPAESAAPAESGEAAAGSTVLYEVESDAATSQSISYATVDDGNFGQEQANGAELPWSNEVEITGGGEFDFNSFSLTAQAAQGATTITCRITVDGEVIAEQTSTGEFAVVTCSGS